MHIAFISSMRKPTEVNAPGGAEVWATQFLLEGINRNYTFDLYAIKGSLEVPGKIKLHQVLEKGLDEIQNHPFFYNSKEKQREIDVYAAKAYTQILFEIKEKENSYDLVIDSASTPHFGINWSFFKIPLMIIGHSPVQSRSLHSYSFYSIPKNVSFVFPSHYQYTRASWIQESIKYKISHGTSVNLPLVNSLKNNQIIFVGRYHLLMPKGVEDAIDVANTVQKPLSIYTYVDNAQMSSYKVNILPKVENNSLVKIFLPPQPPKNEIFHNAKVFLFPTKSEESFGLVMLEAMATGTPVVAYARGAVPEIVKDGETGFIVNPSDDDIRGDFIIKKTGIEGLCEAVERIYRMPEDEYRQMRKNARAHVEQNFTIERMVDQYEELFKKILNK